MPFASRMFSIKGGFVDHDPQTCCLGRTLNYASISHFFQGLYIVALQENVAYRLHLHQCPVCLVRLIWMVLEMVGRWQYSCCFVGCWFRDLFNIARSILVQFPSSFFSIRSVSVHIVHLYCSKGTTAAGKKLCFISTDRSDFHMTDPRHMDEKVFDEQLEHIYNSSLRTRNVVWSDGRWRQIARKS